MRVPSRFLPFLLVACGGPVTDSGSAGPASGSTTTSGSPAYGEPLPVYDSRLEGVVTDGEDVPLGQLQVTLCAGICQVAVTEADGGFVFEGAWPQPNVLESVDYPGADQAEAALHWTRFFELVDFAPDEEIVLDRPMRMHRVEPARDLSGPQDLEPVPGLRVAFDADQIGVDHPLPFPVEEVALGAVSLPPQDWPTATGDWTGVAAWGFAPWDLELDDGFAVTATLPEPIPDGHEAAFLVADYVTGFRDGVMEVEPADLSPDRLVVSTPPGNGLNRTTLWVLATRPL